jgi:hypothetical protein
MTISKERRADLIQALENGDPVDCDAELLLAALRELNEADKRFEAVQAANFKSAQERIMFARKNRALKHEIRNLHRARKQDWETNKRWRKEFLAHSERLLTELTGCRARIAVLENERSGK